MKKVLLGSLKKLSAPAVLPESIPQVAQLSPLISAAVIAVVAAISVGIVIVISAVSVVITVIAAVSVVMLFVAYPSCSHLN